MDYPNWHDKVVLIAEDEAFNFVYLEEVLEPTQITILSADDGFEAIDMVKKHPEIDLVLMDIKMPNLNGFEATKKIKLIRPELKVVAQTAFAMEDERIDIMAAGCDGYIVKPIEEDIFFEVITPFLS